MFAAQRSSFAVHALLVTCWVLAMPQFPVKHVFFCRVNAERTAFGLRQSQKPHDDLTAVWRSPKQCQELDGSLFDTTMLFLVFVVYKAIYF